MRLFLNSFVAIALASFLFLMASFTLAEFIPKNAPILRESSFIKLWFLVSLTMYITHLGRQKFVLKSGYTIAPIIAFLVFCFIVVTPRKSDEETRLFFILMITVIWAVFYFNLEEKIIKLVKGFYSERLGRVFVAACSFWVICALVYVIALEPFKFGSYDHGWMKLFQLIIIPPVLGLTGIGLFKYFLKDTN